MANAKPSYDLLKLILNLFIIITLIALTYLIARPFLFGLFWAVMVVIATWPFMQWIQKRFLINRFCAVVIMTLLLALIFVIPVGLIVYSITKNSSFLIEWTKNISHQPIPTLNWLHSVPLVGSELYDRWQNAITSSNSRTLLHEVQPYFGTIISWVITQLANFSVLIFHCAVMVVFSALLFYKGERWSDYTLKFADRIAPQNGSYAVHLAGQAIRAVALGIVVTALAQAVIGGLSLEFTGIRYAGLLTLFLFICCVAQIGPLFVMVPAVIWQFYHMHILAGIILTVVSIALVTVDSVIRAALIKRGANLPFLLILCGVLGGILAFGIIGIFVGPVVLALSYKLINGWIAE